jgi:hypothetical protein
MSKYICFIKLKYLIFQKEGVLKKKEGSTSSVPSSISSNISFCIFTLHGMDNRPVVKPPFPVPGPGSRSSLTRPDRRLSDTMSSPALADDGAHRLYPRLYAPTLRAPPRSGPPLPETPVTHSRSGAHHAWGGCWLLPEAPGRRRLFFHTIHRNPTESLRASFFTGS